MPCAKAIKKTNFTKSSIFYVFAIGSYYELFGSFLIILLQETLRFFLGISKNVFFFRLKEVADRINRLGHNLHPALSNLHVGVKRICLGSTCIALLLEDGRVCRISYNILPERLDLSKNDSKR